MLLSAGLPADQLGVITPYRQQIKLLSSLLEDFPAIEILTADRSQGRDKECIVMSLTRSNDERKVTPASIDCFGVLRLTAPL